jgi:hypothetical protein
MSSTKPWICDGLPEIAKFSVIERVEVCNGCKVRKVTLEAGRTVNMPPSWKIPDRVDKVDEIFPYSCEVCPGEERFD